MENTLKIMGEINERIYGINPFKDNGSENNQYELAKEEELEKLEMERAVDLEELKKDEYYGR